MRFTVRPSVKRFLPSLALLFAAPLAVAAPGGLDRTFSSDGYAVVAGGGLVPGRDGAMLSGGRILALSGSSARRITAAGILDPDYHPGAPAARGESWGFVPRAKGGALVGVMGRHLLSVRALDGDGRPDRSFGGGDGFVTLTEVSVRARLLRGRGGGAYILDGAMHADPPRPLHLRRLTATGKLDRTFGVRLLQTPAGNGLKLVTSAATAPDGRLYIGGEAVTEGPVLLRLLPDGTFDPTFGQDGAMALSVTPEVLGVQNGAGIVFVIGSRAKDRRVVGFRITSAGVVDPEWRHSGNEPLWMDAADPTDAFVDSAGRLVIARTASNGTPSLTRMRDDGRIDRNFGRNGVANLPGAKDGSVIYRVMPAPNNRIVALGTAGVRNDIAVWRVDGARAASPPPPASVTPE